MGYTHKWRREKDVARETMCKIIHDFKKVAKEAEKAVILAGGNGEGGPLLEPYKISFNGVTRCGHTGKDLGITWPSDKAGGVARPSEDVEVGGWFAGAELVKRACGGDCSHETFYFPECLDLEDWQEPDEDGRYFEFCKTAYKPYDLLVISILIIVKHHLGDKIKVTSDGTDEQWFDGKLLCNTVLGYGLSYSIHDQYGLHQKLASRELK